MQTLPTLIQDLAIMLSVAGITTLICQKIRQPTVLGYLIAGIIIGPHTPYPFVTDIPNIETISQLGVIFLIFAMGLELNFHKLSRVGFSAGIIGLFEVSLMMLIGFGAGQLIGWSFYNSLFLGAALSISSTTIIIKTISELGWTKRKFAEVIFGVLVIEDVLAILLLVILATIPTAPHLFSPEIAWTAGKLVLVITGWFITGYFLVPTFIKKITEFTNDEGLVLVSIGLCLFLSCAAVYFDYSAALGAFIMGSVLAESKSIKQIERLVTPVKDIFAAVFFVSVGMLIDPYIIVTEWPTVLFITLLTIAGKLTITTIGALISGQSLNNALRVGMGMAQIGEFSFIIAGLGQALGLTSPKLYSAIVAASGVTTFTTPYLIRFSVEITTAANHKVYNKLKHTIERYSKKIRHPFNPNEPKFLKKSSTRLLVNGILVAIIFIVIYHALLPKIDVISDMEHVERGLAWLIALLISAPFLWGMLFAGKPPRNPNHKKHYKASKCFNWMVTVIEFLILSTIYFDKDLPLMLLATLFAIFFTIVFRYLGKSYHLLEKHLISNLNGNGFHSEKYKELASWDSSLNEIEVSPTSSLVGKHLKETQPRQEFEINIVAIHRNQETIIAPNGEEKIEARDKLIVLGEHENVELFREMVETEANEETTDSLLQNFGLKKIRLEDKHPLVGKTVTESEIREKTRGLIVGVERDGHQVLNPDSSFILKANDLLLIAGESTKLHSFK